MNSSGVALTFRRNVDYSQPAPLLHCNLLRVLHAFQVEGPALDEAQLGHPCQPELPDTGAGLFETGAGGTTVIVIEPATDVEGWIEAEDAIQEDAGADAITVVVAIMLLPPLLEPPVRAEVSSAILRGRLREDEPT